MRKALFRKELARTTTDTETAVTDCAPAKWERHPAHVTFLPGSGQPFTVNVVPHHAEELLGDSEVEQ